MQTKKWKDKQHTAKSNIANDGRHGKREQNNPMVFKLNKICCKNINVKSYTHQCFFTE